MTDAKTKKMINDPADLIAELIDGMVGAHPDILRLEGETGRAIVAVDGPRIGKVGIVIGGGSGHEPLFCGYVGRGLADACAVGNIFASPSPDQCADAGRSADGGAGVLFLYGNYTGDVMNFDMASEALARDGITARSVLVTDDVASGPTDRKYQRRGIAGDVLVFKIAGAAADQGMSMAEVERLARRANVRTASMGVALGPCSMPQTRTPNFEIGTDEMEIGMGIHGEPGIARVPLETADRIADRLLAPILDDLGLTAGDRVTVLVNGLGSTAMLELYLIHRRVRRVLAERGIAIHSSRVGEYATSLEMAGASVTLMHLDDDLTAFLTHPCRTVAMSVGEAPAHLTAVRKTRTQRSVLDEVIRDRASLKADGALTPARFCRMMLAVADAIAFDTDRLSQLDGAIGDGDHGVTMDMGWTAIRPVLSAAGDQTITEICAAMSHTFLEAVGASAGPLYASGFSAAGDAVADRMNLDARALAAWIEGLASGIAKRGGAAPGEKTMIDAWHPAAVAAVATANGGGTIRDVLAAAATAAGTGMLATADMIAVRGRAAKLGDRAKGHIDPGAASAVTMLDAMSADANRG